MTNVLGFKASVLIVMTLIRALWSVSYFRKESQCPVSMSTDPRHLTFSVSSSDTGDTINTQLTS